MIQADSGIASPRKGATTTSDGSPGRDASNAIHRRSGDTRGFLIDRWSLDVLGRLAGPDFASAFFGSTNQGDYRWDKLHRIVLRHRLGGPFNVPPAFGAVTSPLGDALPGLPVDGGFWTVDASKHDPRAQSANDFMFDRSADTRFVAEAGAGGIRSESAWPGGTSGVPGERFYVNLRLDHLTNDTLPLLFQKGDLQRALYSVSRFVPKRR